MISLDSQFNCSREKFKSLNSPNILENIFSIYNFYFKNYLQETNDIPSFEDLINYFLLRFDINFNKQKFDNIYVNLGLPKEFKQE